MFLVSALPLRAVVPVLRLFAPREPLLRGTLGESAPRAEPVSGELEGEACLDLAAEIFLLSSPKLEIYLEKRQKAPVSSYRNTIVKPENMDTFVAFRSFGFGAYSRYTFQDVFTT